MYAWTLTGICSRSTAVGLAVCIVAAGCRHAAPGLYQTFVQVPAQPDSAWAVRIATGVVPGGESPMRVVSFYDSPDGYLVRLSPAGPVGLPCICGGLVWVGKSGPVVLLGIDQ
jgi:hypothetical protein